MGQKKSASTDTSVVQESFIPRNAYSKRMLMASVLGKTIFIRYFKKIFVV